jgi:hypothetical protein
LTRSEITHTLKKQKRGKNWFNHSTNVLGGVGGQNKAMLELGVVSKSHYLTQNSRERICVKWYSSPLKIALS